MIYETGRPARAHESDWLPRGPDGRVIPMTSGVGAPVVVEGSLWGVMAVGSSTGLLPPDTEARLAAFTELIATAIANAQAHDELSASRARVVASADETRRRIERDLHDGAQQQFVSIALRLRLIQASVPPEQVKLAEELDRVCGELSEALDRLQELARGIHPAILTEAGLEPALRALARRCPVPVQLDVRTKDRLPGKIEATAYYIVSEALTNAAKHANATVVRVDVDTTDSVVRLAVRDEGAGGADPARGSGLLGLRDRAQAVGGTVTVHSPIGEGTEVLAELPQQPGPAPG
jgi:signal transduction histidine kinase